MASKIASLCSWARSSWVTDMMHYCGAGLLGSSCCALQLGINLLAALNLFDLQAQCAGFNKVLGPLRVELRIATALWLAYSWILALLQKRPKRRLVVGTAVCAFLTFLPEILLSSGGPRVGWVGETHTIQLQVDGMGCEACLRHVRGVLSEEGAIETTIDLDTGAGKVEVVPGGGFNLTAAAEKLEKAGFWLRAVDAAAGGSGGPEADGASISPGGPSEL